MRLVARRCAIPARLLPVYKADPYVILMRLKDKARIIYDACGGWITSASHSPIG